MQVDKTFRLAEKPNLTFEHSDTFMPEINDNPMDDNFSFNSYLLQIASGVQLLMLKVHCLNQNYNALIDSGSSHNFISQQTYDQLRQIQKNSDVLGVEQAIADCLQVVLADGTSTESRNRMCIQVILENRRFLQVQCNIIPSLAQ